MNKQLAIISVFIIIMFGFFYAMNINKIIPQNIQEQPTTVKTLPEKNSTIDSDSEFDTGVLYSKEWVNGITYETEDISVDLRRVCVKEEGSTLDCKYFDYWTNNRTGNWEKIKRDNGDTQGSNFCEYFEEWKVALGSPCTRLNGESQNSFVKF